MPLIDNFSFDNYGLGGVNKDEASSLLTSGNYLASSASTVALRFDNRTSQGSTYFITASLLNFKSKIPKYILIKYGGFVSGLFIRDVKNQYGDSLGLWGGSFSCIGSLSTDNFYVTENSFKLPVYQTLLYTWEAYG